jgi:hypothetical protein
LAERSRGLEEPDAVPDITCQEVPMSDDRDQRLRQALAQLKQQHRDLDAAIQELEQGVRADQLQIKRLKKKKLALKDEIARVEDELLPDIIA